VFWIPAAIKTNRPAQAGLLVFGLLVVVCILFVITRDGLNKAQRGVLPNNPRKESTIDPRDEKIISRLQPTQLRFPVFHTSLRDLPASVRLAVIHQPIFGINWRLARRLPVHKAAQVWAIPGNGHVCLVSIQRPNGLGVTCTTTQVALEHGLSSTFLREGRSVTSAVNRVILGITPAGTSKVVASGSTPTVFIPVRRGVFVRRDHGTNPPDRFTLIRRSQKLPSQVS
jgi:hypothetical protein